MTQEHSGISCPCAGSDATLMRGILVRPAMRQPIKFGKYLLLERIAVGGMAEVFVAKAFGVEGFERLLGIKKSLPTLGDDAEFISMFVDEARIAVQLSHANIVQVLELGKHDESLYIAMEYISGRDVRQLLERFRKRQQPMPIPQACLIVAEEIGRASC